MDTQSGRISVKKATNVSNQRTISDNTKDKAVSSTVTTARGAEDLESRSLPPTKPCPQCAMWQGKKDYPWKAMIEDENLAWRDPSIHEILQRPMGRAAGFKTTAHPMMYYNRK